MQLVRGVIMTPLSNFSTKFFPRPFGAGVIEGQSEAAAADHYQGMLDYLRDAAVRMMTIPRSSRNSPEEGIRPRPFPSLHATCALRRRGSRRIVNLSISR
jgi:hypothetical protein